MADAVYDVHPAVYDAINAEWEYDRDLQFLRDVATRRDASLETVLEIGCGTGEHTRRLAASYDVTAVDPADGALAYARQKRLARGPSDDSADSRDSDGTGDESPDSPRLDSVATLRAGGLPDLPVDGEFDAVIAIRGVVNHVAPESLAASLDAVAQRLAPDGVFVFDNSPLPPDGTDSLGVDDGRHRDPSYVRIAGHQPRDDGRLDWVEVIFRPPDADGPRVTCNTRVLSPFTDDRLISILNDRFRTVETHNGYGSEDNGNSPADNGNSPADDRTVFVAAEPV